MNIFQKPLFKEIFGLSIAIAVMHKLALSLSLYYTTSWYDVVMHFLGGFLIALLVIRLLFVEEIISPERQQLKQLFFITIPSVIVVGLVWELWELFVGFTDVINDRQDTIIDVIMDTIGAVVALLYFKKYVWKKLD